MNVGRLILCVVFLMPSIALGQRQCVLTDVDKNNRPIEGRCVEIQKKSDNSDTWIAVAAGAIIVGGVSAYVLMSDDDEEYFLALQRYNAWMSKHVESDERGVSIKLFEW